MRFLWVHGFVRGVEAWHGTPIAHDRAASRLVRFCFGGLPKSSLEQGAASRRFPGANLFVQHTNVHGHNHDP